MADPLPNLCLNSSLTIAIAINSFHATGLFLYSPEKIGKLLVLFQGGTERDQRREMS